MLTLRQALWNNHPEPNAKFDSDQPLGASQRHICACHQSV